MDGRLYYESLYQAEFDAAVLQQEERNGQYHVVLDRTAFYPGGGGQPCDLGKLGDIPVEEVYEKDKKIFHVLNQRLVEEQVHAALDWERRFELMQQHLGQHILSAVFVKLFTKNTVNLRLDREAVSIDLDGYVRASQAEEAEAMANDVIYHNIPVEILYPDMEEIRKNSRRAIPETEEAIRIVKISDLDYTPCCGLQTKTTGEVGIIKIQRVDSQRDGSRIYFTCGRAALRWLSGICRCSLELQKEFTCGEDEIAGRTAKQREELKNLKERYKILMQRYYASSAPELIGSAPKTGDYSIVTYIMEDATQEEMKLLYAELTAKKGVIALLGGKTADGANLIFGCNKADKTVDVRDIFKDAIALIGGKGGGSASCAQGCGVHSTKLWDAVNGAREKITGML